MSIEKIMEKKTHWVALDFKVKVDRGKARNGEPHKFARNRVV